jgi:Tfp pilus assembly pilus retraction ATPase PilT
VFTTIHATNASMAVQRIVSLFDPDQKNSSSSSWR